MHCVVATHGHCFDGLASAVLFTTLLRKLETDRISFEFVSCGYGAKQLLRGERLRRGDLSAILDYRFCAKPAPDWYFDHHPTAFATDADRLVYESKVSTGKYYFDAQYGSCTKLIADVAKREFGVQLEELQELVRWADIVDTARFESAQAAVDRTEPVLQLVSVVEQHGDARFIEKLVPELQREGLQKLATSAAVSRLYAPIGKKRETLVERVRERASARGRVVFVDLTDNVQDTVGKFVTYALFPDSVYSVVVGRLANAVKISVGYNPWCGVELDTDISKICARHGGGGHAVVGGISFAAAERERAVDIATEIATELS